MKLKRKVRNAFWCCALIGAFIAPALFEINILLSFIDLAIMIILIKILEDYK